MASLLRKISKLQALKIQMGLDRVLIENQQTIIKSAQSTCTSQAHLLSAIQGELDFYKRVIEFQAETIKNLSHKG